MVNTTQIKSVDKRSIKEKVGTLLKKRMDEVHEGLKIVMGIAMKEERLISSLRHGLYHRPSAYGLNIIFCINYLFIGTIKRFVLCS